MPELSRVEIVNRVLSFTEHGLKQKSNQPENFPVSYVPSSNTFVSLFSACLVARSQDALHATAVRVSWSSMDVP